MSATRLLIFVLFCISSVLSEKKICDLNDKDCLTEGGKRSFKQLIVGLDGMEPSDPLFLDLIEGNLPTLKYKLINGSLLGMLNCEVDLVQAVVQEMKYKYHVGCPHLILKSDYDVKGKLGPEFIEGTGTCKLDIYDYHILLGGDFEKIISTNGKLHLQLKNHKLEYDAKAKVNYDCKNIFNGDKEKSAVLDLTRQPAMEALMNKFKDNVNAFLKITPYEDLFYSE